MHNEVLDVLHLSFSNVSGGFLGHAVFPSCSHLPSEPRGILKTTTSQIQEELQDLRDYRGFKGKSFNGGRVASTGSESLGARSDEQT